MAKISKFVKVDKNVLLEYVYNDGNLIAEAYDILVNSKDKTQSYIATDSTVTGNNVGNQLFRLDAVNSKYAKINPSNYTFLQVKNFTSGTPIRHDTIKLHLPVNWTFGEYLGLFIRIYTYDSQNFKTYDISNFYFDMTDISQQYLMNYTSPPLLFQEKLWGKYIQLQVPAISEISSQLTNNRPKENSINANLTNGTGLSMTAPIFVDFHFIDNIQTINANTTYRLTAKVTTSFSQTPEFERLGLMIRKSPNGDFFEIYGTYNDTLQGFNQFIQDSFNQGNRYYAQFSITVYEQNIRGKTLTYTMNDNFNETIDFRPIIKNSTTTAIIDVEMKLIDLVDDSYIIRRASYGMLQDEVAKYSLKLMKINLQNAMKPKVYNMRSTVDPSSIGLGRNRRGIMQRVGLGPVSLPTNLLQNGGIGGGLLGTGMNNNNLATGIGGGIENPTAASTVAANGLVQTVKVPFPVLVDRYNIIGKSENALLNSTIFYGLSKMQIVFYPFDNIIKFTIATGEVNSPNYLDMTNFGEIKLVMKNTTDLVETTLYSESTEINLQIGQIVFKVEQGKFATIKKIHDSGVNIFYITSLNQNITSVIYTGIFKIYDNRQNVADINNQAAANSPGIIQDPKLPRQTAIITRVQVPRPSGRGGTGQ